MQSSLAALQDLIKVAAPAVTTIFVILQYRLNRRNAISQVYQERKRVYSGCYRMALSVMDDFADPCHEKILNEVNKFYVKNPGYTQLFDAETSMYIAGIVASAGQYAMIMKKIRDGEDVDSETKRAPVGIRTYMMEQISRGQGRMSALDRVFLEAVNTFPPRTTRKDKTSNRFVKKYAPAGPWGRAGSG